MTHLRIFRADGTLAAETDAPAGDTLLHVCQELGLPLEGTCEGAMACSTCHVLVDAADLRKLPPPCSMEEDMLDFTAHVGPTSRLSCQIELRADLDSLDLTLPPSHNNMMERS